MHCVCADDRSQNPDDKLSLTCVMACLEGDGVHGLVADNTLPQLSRARLLSLLIAHLLACRLQRIGNRLRRARLQHTIIGSFKKYSYLVYPSRNGRAVCSQSCTQSCIGLLSPRNARAQSALHMPEHSKQSGAGQATARLGMKTICPTRWCRPETFLSCTTTTRAHSDWGGRSEMELR